MTWVPFGAQPTKLLTGGAPDSRAANELASYATACAAIDCVSTRTPTPMVDDTATLRR